MPVWTANTVNPYKMSREIPMMLGSTQGNTPRTISVVRSLNFPMPQTGATERLDGDWLLTGFRARPDQPRVSATVSITVDGIVVLDNPLLRETESVVGPSSGDAPNAPGSIPRYIISKNYIELYGRCNSSSTFYCEYVAIQLEYA